MNDDLMMREVKLKEGIMNKIDKAQSLCYVYMSGVVYIEGVRICYYWNDVGRRRSFERFYPFKIFEMSFERVYPFKILEMSDEEIIEMFFLDWVFR